jgi:hypothetical protein
MTLSGQVLYNKFLCQRKRFLPPPIPPPQDNGGQCRRQQAVATFHLHQLKRCGIGIFCWSSKTFTVGCCGVAESIDSFKLVFLLFSIIIAQQAVIGGLISFNLLQSVLLRIADAVSLFFYYAALVLAFKF